DELLVLRVRQIVHPLLRAGNADGKVLKPRQRQLVDGERGVERNLALHAGLGVLRYELDAGAAGIEREDRVGLRRTGLRQLGGEVELVRPGGQFAADDLTLEGRSNAFKHVLAGRIVRADQERGL